MIKAESTVEQRATRTRDGWSLRPPMMGLLVVAIGLAGPPTVRAGMPGITLTDVAGLRLDAISFFVAIYLISAAAARAIWNGLRIDFPWMPRLSYGRALGLVFVWGMLFLLVLTMISGARELMTPGAWKKQGLTYQLAPDGSPSDADDEIPARLRSRELWLEREEQLRSLFDELLDFEESHAGRLPGIDEFEGLAAARAAPPDRPGWHYRYVPGPPRTGGPRILVYEPAAYEGPRLALWSTGRVRRLDTVSPELLPAPAASDSAAGEASP